MNKTSFSPIVNNESTGLILGTMPEEESLRKQEYYGNSRNQFWRILYTIFNEEFSIGYANRVALLHKHGIELWDVLQSCESVGSLDSSIKNEKANDFRHFYKEHPHISSVFLTSQKATSFYKKHIGFNHRLTYYTLPSPSTANAKMTLEEKISI